MYRERDCVMKGERREKEREKERKKKRDRENRSKLAARGIAELPLIKAIKLVEQLSLIMDVAWPLTRAVLVVVAT